MTQTIAVTGASGYIGTRVTAYLRATGYRVLAMGRRPAEGADGFIPFTLGAANDYAPLVGADALLHCAYDFTPRGYDTLWHINGEGSAELMREARARGVSTIIYISSVSAFPEAVADYGRVKYETERYAHQNGAFVVRPGLVFSRNAGGIVGALDKLAAKLPVIPVPGKGDQRFYPCHVDDLAALLAYLLKQKTPPQAPIVAACERSVTFTEIIATLAQLHHKKRLIMPVPYWAVYAGLKLGEALHLPTGLRSDSLRYMKYANLDLDFDYIRQAGINFRAFTTEALRT